MQVTNRNNPFTTQVLPTGPLSLTDAKVQKIGLGTMGSLFLIASAGLIAAPFTFGCSGLVTLAITPLFFIGSLACFLGSIACFSEIRMIQNYESAVGGLNLLINEGKYFP